MNRLLPNLITFLIFSCASISSFASHIVGGDLKITMISNGPSSSNYHIQLRLYRDDINGNIPMPSAVTIGIYQIGTNILETTKVLDLDNNNTSIVPFGDSCFSPNPLVIRVEEGVYNGLTSISLPNFSMGYYIQYQTWARNASVTNLADPDNDGISIFAIIPDPALGQNSSPDFGNYPNDAYFCLNRTNSFIWPVTEPDGDSLVFSLVQPLNSNGSATGSSPGSGAYPYYPTCPYAVGYSLTSLGPGTPPFTINSVTGEIFGSPAINGNFVFAVRIEEFRNGLKIGEVRRDVQYAVEPLCPVLVRVDSIVSCDSLMWIDGNTYTASNNSATYTIQNTGCDDSLIILDLTIGYTGSVFGDTTICIGDSAELYAEDGLEYFWYPTNVLSNADSNWTYAYPQQNTNFKVIIKYGNIYGCEDTFDVAVNVSPIPFVNAGLDFWMKYGEPITLNASTNASNFYWESTSWISCNTCLNPQINPYETTLYVLNVADSIGCLNSDTVEVKINGSIYVPNTFTPNGDGINDNFEIKGENIKSFELWIYNRWGEEIYRSLEMNDFWDGKYGGNKCKIDSYIWVIEFQDFNNNFKSINGHINLIE